MILVDQDDLLRALKRFKGIAKQDLLLAEQNLKAEFRKTHAEARRESYTRLIEMVEESGIENACVFAFSEYLNLPVCPTQDPVMEGHIQALEMFFTAVGIEPDKLKMSKSEHIGFTELMLNPVETLDCYAQSNH